MRQAARTSKFNRSRVIPMNQPTSSDPMARDHEFRGNKQSLDSKLCAACGRTMTWRKRWARNWEAVRYCSEACRRKRATPADAGGQAK